MSVCFPGSRVLTPSGVAPLLGNSSLKGLKRVEDIFDVDAGAALINWALVLNPNLSELWHINCLRGALRATPNYADAMFNLALLLQRGNKHAEAAEYWRRYLAKDGKSEWAARARRSLKFCEMQIHLSAS